MKKILVTEKQQKQLQEALETMSHLPLYIIDKISSNETPLSDCQSFSNKKNILKLLSKSYQKTIEEFSDDITKYDESQILNVLSKLTIKCIRKEQSIKKQLENLCLNIVNDIFNIPEEGVEIGCELKDEISFNKQFHIEPENNEEIQYDDVVSLENNDKEVEKRKILNAIIVGMAMNLSDKIRNENAQKLFELDEELPHLYNKVMKINDYLLFIKDVDIKDNHHEQGGYVDTKLGSDITPTKIEAYGIMFPILLYETIKGCMELFISHGLPDDKNMAEEVVNNADALINDPWYMRFGKSFFNYDIPSKYIPTFLTNLSEISTDEFFNVIKEIIYNTKKGEEIINDLIEKSQYDDDYSDFEKDMDKKQNDKDLIEDDYFSSEELDEAIYPDNFNMNVFKSLNSFNKRIKYCETYLQRISSGSSRIVYKIDDNTVLKLAKNQKGIAQNELEGREDYYRNSIDIFAEVYDIDENYLWIEMQLAKKAKPSDFKRLVGFPMKTICQWLYYIANTNSCWIEPKYKEFFKSDDFYDIYEEFPIFKQLEDYVGNYDIPIGDLMRISSWGVVQDKDGSEKLVLVDFGLDYDIGRKYYGFR